MTETVMVIRTGQITEVKKHFEQMGMVFVEEQHGKGPIHYACQVGDIVTEIYPLGKDNIEKIDFI
jgi:hypothetical protein